MDYNEQAKQYGWDDPETVAALATKVAQSAPVDGIGGRMRQYMGDGATEAVKILRADGHLCGRQLIADLYAECAQDVTRRAWLQVTIERIAMKHGIVLDPA